jgi:Domain of unknown function (DUF1992)
MPRPPRRTPPEQAQAPELPEGPRRKPAGMSFTSWIDQQVHEAAERGAFDNLPGAGKPLPRRPKSDDGMAWLRGYLRREGVSPQEMLPTPLRLRKEIERLAETVGSLPSEQAVRDEAAALNRQIAAWRRIPEGPPIYVRLVDADAMVARWREAQPPPARPSAGSGATAPGLAQARPRWWRRFRRQADSGGTRP